MKKKILLISFDFIKESYSDITYSIATIMSSLKYDKDFDYIEPEHYGINLSELYRKFNKNTEKINDNIKFQFWNELRTKSFNYDFIAIGVTTWSNIHVEYLVNEVLTEYSGKLILGGYEVTATDDKTLLKTYPKADYFIKGYSETALKKIINNNYNGSTKIINETLDQKDLISPYISGLLSTNMKKVHWETKRGCPYKCGFCEWGNASNKKVIPINQKRLLSEIDLFKKSNIEEINLLDGTYNFGKEYIDHLENILYNTNAKITMQSRFENVNDRQNGERFLEVCKKFSNRVKLEFGLQTIHQLEMNVIGRRNDLTKVKSVMSKLNDIGIHYEVSLIYGIPGQTYNSFSETVEYVLNNGCENVRAFPLRIPRNSEMEKQKGALGVKETTLEFNVDQVTSSYSFDNSDYEKMQQLSEKLYLGDLKKDSENIKSKIDKANYILFEEDSPYEWRMKNVTRKNPIVYYEKVDKVQPIQKEQKRFDVEKDDFIEFALRKIGEKVLDIAVDKGGKYIKQKAKENPRLQMLIDFFEDVYKSEFWTYKDKSNNEYFCNLKLTASGNVLIFKGNQRTTAPNNKYRSFGG
ncbi:B12-binding domain-containing radical SAM protein [uncultured Draconibacterium sp.]|uniref:B12-binding domain-containing radical SAM protein n=1 Tax=uncultured Draconibacterium sp. TaxID=1573823 RepID=UPI0025CFE7D0|nr:B12-binding domain-containing radical SAM protein [uncultured Draconibacterium sp.]